ncbi:hypothetical protein HDV06_000799 [Boothiomyces sp. JEL0866]|nr:hypothetical protein HDV06_000799 [Boothiomyces sp. JEL0866]
MLDIKVRNYQGTMKVLLPFFLLCTTLSALSHIQKGTGNNEEELGERYELTKRDQDRIDCNNEIFGGRIASLVVYVGWHTVAILATGSNESDTEPNKRALSSLGSTDIAHFRDGVDLDTLPIVPINSTRCVDYLEGRLTFSYSSLEAETLLATLRLLVSNGMSPYDACKEWSEIKGRIMSDLNDWYYEMGQVEYLESKLGGKYHGRSVFTPHPDSHLVSTSRHDDNSSLTLTKRGRG